MNSYIVFDLKTKAASCNDEAAFLFCFVLISIYPLVAFLQLPIPNHRE
jgi:hypothetical protein